MNLIKPHLLAIMLLAAYGVPGAVLAETTTVAAVASAPTDASEAVDAAPADRMELKQSVPNSKVEMTQPMDPARCKALLEKRATDRDAFQKLGPDGGIGMMLRPGMDSDGRPGRMEQRNPSCHDELNEQRIDALETRVDMMQMMLRMMLGR
jgi:hypothetical protein